MSKAEISKEYAIRCHKNTNCEYGGNSYDFHLGMVVEVGKNFIHLIPEEDRDLVTAVLWGHDVIEDTRQTYNDVKKVLGVVIADLIYCVTNELGKNRKERAEKTYPKIAGNLYATFAKMCDRYANTWYSKNKGSSMYEKYKNEYAEFRLQLIRSESAVVYEEFWRALDNLNCYVPTTKN